MARASLDWARQRGFRAMQYNLVVSTNDRAVRLWQRLGFAIVGTVPAAFEHPTHGFVAVHVMYRSLTA
jgi:ribosomal protein S18 acetylase RimI-like enzyme